ncbi:MAG: N,N'-diacetylchitobiose phosphorylase [Clostridiales bacterium]|nr:N,N'-diacetylchitobiose phosphorylase [Clostridiales bacterium]
MRYGRFDNQRREYVIERVDAPFSLTNYLGTGRLGAVVSQNAGGYLWAGSPQYGRVTRFRPNGVPLDGPGHYVYVRDDADGAYWSLSWQPVGLPLPEAKYECRHGLSYARYLSEVRGIRGEQTLFIPLDDDCELWEVRLRNTGDRPRELSVFGYCEFSFHNIEMDNQNFQMSLYAAGSRFVDGLVEYELHYEEDCREFFACSAAPHSYDGLRDAFIGSYRTERNPVGVERGVLTGSAELGGNHCGALHTRVRLAPGAEARLRFLLGPGDAQTGRRLRAKYDDQTSDEAFQALADHWSRKLSALQVNTPDADMNTSLNLWNLYQSQVNVSFSRFASFIEVGGRTGLGYRDTAQDAMCIPHADPAMCRLRIEQLLHGQVSAGYGLHLFDPAWFERTEDDEAFNSPTVVPTAGKARVHSLRDACADDALWLIPAIAEYVRETGELDFLTRRIPFADGGEATVYDHARRALDFSFEQVGAHGVCKGLRADWNDCLNLGGGESAMVAFLLLWAVEHFCDMANALGQEAAAAEYSARANAMKAVCRRELWDGAWFLRGITGNGKPIGSKAAAEGKVHLESNAWAVLSGAATKEQGLSCMDAVYDWLFTPYGLMLNAPSFTVRDDGIGFITRVYKGIKENGAVFSHSNPWAWVAEAMLGRGDRAMELYLSLLPEKQNDLMEIRQAEPYSYCQFIMGRDHTAHGRARHPFMTGSAGWSYYAATRYLLGVRPGFAELTVDPCIPAAWDGFTVTRAWRGAIYHIDVTNPEHVCKGVAAISVDGQAAQRIPVFAQGEHRVTVRLGRSRV